MDAPIHPGCINASKPYGKTRAGSQRWKCPDCRKVWVAEPKAAGRPRSGKALTNAQRRARYYLREKRRMRGEID